MLAVSFEIGKAIARPQSVIKTRYSHKEHYLSQFMKTTDSQQTKVEFISPTSRHLWRPAGRAPAPTDTIPNCYAIEMRCRLIKYATEFVRRRGIAKASCNVLP
ncbi:hypothetical protein EVAR_78449_1 [Eumeta japonica]|uniref:Uncharacterized protein n=1 Tax=Eumeta variegata TaxID=151549 RepID=A0A4C1TY47_EUMVA|nr:hypothetical protein EVAR_78449_1 [Eumeta japonica]